MGRKCLKPKSIHCQEWSSGWKFNVKTASDADYFGQNGSAYFNQNGHKVFWELSLNTAKLKDVAATDVIVEVLAVDRSNRQSNSNALQSYEWGSVKEEEGAAAAAPAKK